MVVSTRTFLRPHCAREGGVPPGYLCMYLVSARNVSCIVWSTSSENVINMSVHFPHLLVELPKRPYVAIFPTAQNTSHSNSKQCVAQTLGAISSQGVTPVITFVVPRSPALSQAPRAARLAETSPYRAPLRREKKRTKTRTIPTLPQTGGQCSSKQKPG